MIENTPLKIFNCDNCLFKNIICQYITPDQFEHLYKNTIQLRFKKNEYILKQNTNASQMVFLSKGRVKMNYETDSGKNIILTISNSPNLLGGANMLNEGINVFSIIAIEDCEVCMLDINILKSFILENSLLSFKMLELISQMFKHSIFNFISLAHKQVNGRIADVLIYLSKSIYHSHKFTLTITRKEISEFSGCSQENVIHILSAFNKEGIIKVDGKSIEILDFDKLQQISKKG